MKQQRFALMLLTAIFSLVSAAQIPNDSIVADFRYFVKQLEATHPDPYTNYGGKAFFHRAAHEAYWALRDDSVTTTEELFWRICTFLAPLQDGHTKVHYPETQAAYTLVPIRFRAINDCVFVSRLPQEHQHLVGSRLTAIESVPVAELYEEMTKLYPAENDIGKRANICGHGHQPMPLSRIIPNLRSDSITYHLLTPDGQSVALQLPLIRSDEWTQWYKTKPISHFEQFPNENLAFSFIGKGRRTMYFRSTSIMARDNIEYMYKSGVDFYDNLKYCYNKVFCRPMPSDTANAIAALPSFSEEFGKMLQQMKKHKAENLIIDLRGNGGGWSPITYPTLYQLWGDEYLKANFQNYFYRVLSPLYMQKLNLTLDQYNARYHTNYEYGDYTFYENQDKPQTVTDEIRSKFVANSMSCVQEQLAAQNGKPIYTPRHIYVLTDAITFSAAFHYTFYLWKMGATIVGVPSCQAPNTYMEQTPFTLPRTKLKGSISNSLQLFLPVDDPCAKQLTPDLQPTYDDFKRYHFDEQAEVLYLLDKINEKIVKEQ